MVNQKKNVVHVDFKTCTSFCNWSNETESDTEFEEEHLPKQSTVEIKCILETGKDLCNEKKEIVSFNAQLPKNKEMSENEIKTLLLSCLSADYNETTDQFESHVTNMYKFCYNITYYCPNSFRIQEYKIILKNNTINNSSSDAQVIFLLRMGGELMFVYHDMDYFKKLDDRLNINNIDVIRWLHKLNYFESGNDPSIQMVYPGYCQESFIHLFFRYLNTTNEALKKSIGMSKYDLLTVFLENIWLNDQVINKYYSLIKARDNKIEANKTHVFDSFFWPRLVKNGYDHVKNDTKKIDIFSFKKLLFPLNLDNNHWASTCVDFKKKIIVYYDSVSASKKIWLSSVPQIIKNYLALEQKTKKNVEFNISEFCLFDGNSPEQDNSDDCGVFTCINAELFSRDIEPPFYTPYVNLYRQKIVSEILSMELMT